MNILIVGSGGREHSIAWKVRNSPSVKKLFVAPGNGGTGEVAVNVSIDVENINELVNFAKTSSIDLTIVGPELPLSLGIVDRFEKEGLLAFGPSKEAARLESSKSFAKDVMIAAGVRTAGAKNFYDPLALKTHLETAVYPLVLKADGLASGKGVVVCKTKEEALLSIEQLFGFGANDDKPSVLVEDFLVGVEASFIVATDGNRVVPFLPAHDYKRIGEGDTGPNTGGMGTVCPTPRFPVERTGEAVESIIIPVLREMERRGTPFKGFLYAGLMIGEDGTISVVEFNARLGDPECQVIMSSMESDFVDVLISLLNPTKPLPSIRWRDSYSVCVVLAAEGYPSTPRKGDEITGLNLVRSLSGVEVFHAGTKREGEDRYLTSGGRVLNVTGTGATLEDARRAAYRACDMIQFKGRQLRRDIGR